MTTPSWRVSRPSSSARASASAVAGSRPASSSSSTAGPYAATPAACVATAPTPAFAHGTTAPTAKYFDCTAQPTSPVASSAATIEKVALLSWPNLTERDPIAPAPRTAIAARRFEAYPLGVTPAHAVTSGTQAHDGERSRWTPSATTLADDEILGTGLEGDETAGDDADGTDGGHHRRHRR